MINETDVIVFNSKGEVVVSFPNLMAVCTPREFQIAQLLGKGYTNKTIASIIFIEPRTVERHIANIFNKFHMKANGGNLFMPRILIALAARGFTTTFQP